MSFARAESDSTFGELVNVVDPRKGLSSRTLRFVGRLLPLVLPVYE